LKRRNLGLEPLEDRTLLSRFDILGPELPMQGVTLGFQPEFITGDYHGGVFIAGTDPADTLRGAVANGSVSGGSISFGSTMWLPAIGSNPSPFAAFPSDLQSALDGTIDVAGRSTPDRIALAQGAVWTLPASGTGLAVEELAGTEGESENSGILGGDSQGDYAGFVGTRAVVNYGTSLVLLPQPPGVSTASDRYSGVAVGETNGGGT
jgi:hypothetical protein